MRPLHRYFEPWTIAQARDRIATWRSILEQVERDDDHCPCCHPMSDDIDYIERCVNDAEARGDLVERFEFCNGIWRSGRVDYGGGLLTLWLTDEICVDFNDTGDLYVSEEEGRAMTVDEQLADTPEFTVEAASCQASPLRCAADSEFDPLRRFCYDGRVLGEEDAKSFMDWVASDDQVCVPMLGFDRCVD